MKMETPVFVHCNGTVEEVEVNKGDERKENDILAIIAEDLSLLGF